MMENILDKYKHDGYGTDQSCRELAHEFSMRKTTTQLVAEVGVLVITALNMVKEIIQLVQSPISHFKSLDNIMEVVICTLSVLFVVDLSECNELTGLKFGWQWQLGAVTITVAWISYLSNFRTNAFVGIYVVMISKILRTFLKMGLVVICLLWAFALGFHCLLAEQVTQMAKVHENLSAAITIGPTIWHPTRARRQVTRSDGHKPS